MTKRLVVCIDDEKTVLDSLVEQLRAVTLEDIAFEVADSGEEALELMAHYSQKGYELPLVICDYIMPEMNGDEVLARIHAHYPLTSEILLTGQATLTGISEVIRKANLFRFIQKPWHRDDLIQSVHEAIKSYEKDKQILEQHHALADQYVKLKEWAYATVHTLGKALDSRDMCTSDHSRHMGDLAVWFAKGIVDHAEGVYKDKVFSDEEIECLYFSALLHDVGKIGVKETILLKERRLSEEKLEAIENRIRAQFHFFKRLEADQKLSPDDRLFIERSEKLLEKLTALSVKERLDDADLKEVDWICRMIVTDEQGFKKTFLSTQEQKQLRVRHGNLTDEERRIVETHAKLSHDILKDIPWPPHLEKVPEIAASHHERLDGSGYFLGLKGDQIGIGTRIISILDVFEALTSGDRPYRKRKSMAEAIAILKHEAEAGRLDAELVSVFAKMIHEKESEAN